MKTIKISKENLRNLKSDFADTIINTTNEHIFFTAKTGKTTIIAYNSGSIVIQGLETDIFYTTIAQKYLPKIKCSAGSDEVGTGDVFGPIVVCACVVQEKDIELLKNLNIQDSKKINDQQIKEIGPKLHKSLVNSLIIMNNEKYNEVIVKNNMNVIKAKLHNRAYLNLSKKINLLEYDCYIDQFTPKSKYFEYLKNEEKIYTDLVFETKAESKYISVACASIIARYAFLIEMEKIENKYNFTIPKGAGTIVDDALIRFNRIQPENLSKVCKMNFKNLQKIQ